MVHLNGHLLAAVDVETTGLIVGYHDLIQIAVVPLDATIKPIQGVMPFYMNLTPHYPEHIDKGLLASNKIPIMDIIRSSIDPDKVADLFDEWFDALNLPVTAKDHKKLMPLWSNGQFDRSFLMQWLGPENYSNYFHFHERDTQVIAAFLNDRYDHHAEFKLPFTRLGLNDLARFLEVYNDKPHDALQDALTTAAVYKALLTGFYIPA